MSCAGKTTFAKTLQDHHYYCFDYLFQWHLIETLGLSISENFKHIQKYCVQPKFVLDGWHLADKTGVYLPPNSSVYVVWAPYENIISQYRVKVTDPEEHRNMYKKWYFDIDYDALPKVRYFSNFSYFEEITKEDFIISSKRNQ